MVAVLLINLKNYYYKKWTSTAPQFLLVCSFPDSVIAASCYPAGFEPSAKREELTVIHSIILGILLFCNILPDIFDASVILDVLHLEFNSLPAVLVPSLPLATLRTACFALVNKSSLIIAAQCSLTECTTH